MAKKEIPVNLSVDLDKDEALTTEEALSRAIMILAKTDTPKVLTELDDYEIKLSAALFAVSENIQMFDMKEDKMIQNFLINFLLLRVSNKRQGRKELLEIAKAARQEPEGRMSKLRQIFGMK